MAGEVLLAGYVFVFGATALACFVSLARARQVVDPDTRRGLVWLLALSGTWAAAHVGLLISPTVPLGTAFYMAGLVVGFAAVGAWLYFCSAYTGRSIHRSRLVRRAALVLFAAVVLVKLTNPLHGLYFTAEVVSTPFPHLAVHNGLFHWVAMGLAYALAFVGYFMLLELFLQVSYDTRPFIALVSLTGLPVVFDVLGIASPYLIDITYEPIGVGVFALGVLFVYVDRFQAIQLAAERTEPVVVLNADAELRDYNTSAAELFPALARPGVYGARLATVAPEVSAALDAEQPLLELLRGGRRRYYRVTTNTFGADSTSLGRIVTLTDVTERESYRRELERQNERLEEFASMVSHDLRNPLNVAAGRLELAREEHDNDDLEAVASALARMEELIEDLLGLAREGQPIDEPEPVDLAELGERSWELVETADAELVVEDVPVIFADEDRLRQLLENLFRNAIEHGGTDVTVRVGETAGGDGFYVEDDGPGIPADSRERVLESGFTTQADGTGFGLAIVREIAEAHGWQVRATGGEAGGARFEFTGVRFAG